MVDIKFNEKAANEKTLWFNEIYTPLFEKRKLVKPYERSVIQLLSVLVKNEKGTLNSFKFNEKTHSTMKKKIYLPLYAEHLHFLMTRAGWIATKIYAHYTFEQVFKKDFVIMNQVSQQNTKTNVGKDFY